MKTKKLLHTKCPTEIRKPGKLLPFSKGMAIRPTLLAIIIVAAFGMHVSAQTWQSVDDFQYIAGRPAQNCGLAVAPDGTLFASGFAQDSAGVYHGLVMASGDGGHTWSGALDDYIYALGYDALYDAGMVADSLGNLYVAGESYDSVSETNHWIIRRGTNRGANWSLVDDFAPGGVFTQPFGLTVDSAGNVYVAGIAQPASGGGQVWTIRKGLGGASFNTVDSYSSTGATQANAIYAHPTAGIFAVGSAIVPGTKGYVETEVWLVRRSINGGSTWSTVDSFQLSPNLTSRAFGVGADSSGNLYVVGQGFTKNGKNDYSHWIVRKSSNGGSSWTTVDDFQLSATSNTGAGRFINDSHGNLYVCGGTPFNPWFANEWLVRKCTAGTGFWQTVDDFKYMGGVAEPFATATDASGHVFIGGTGAPLSSSLHWLVRKN